jgi:hypothetical protein
MSSDINSDASEWKHQLAEAKAHSNTLMSASLTHTVKCSGPDSGIGLELLKTKQETEWMKSQAKGASKSKEATLSRHAFVEHNRIKAIKKAKTEAKRSVRSRSLRKIKTHFPPSTITQKIEQRSKNIAH